MDRNSVDFETVWGNAVSFASENCVVKTLYARVPSRVEYANSEEICVVSSAFQPEKHRRLTKKDFSYAWDILCDKRRVYLKDLEKLSGKKSVICAILAYSNPGVIDYGKRPIKLYLL